MRQMGTPKGYWKEIRKAQKKREQSLRKINGSALTSAPVELSRADTPSGYGSTDGRFSTTLSDHRERRPWKPEGNAWRHFP